MLHKVRILCTKIKSKIVCVQSENQDKGGITVGRVEQVAYYFFSLNQLMYDSINLPPKNLCDFNKCFKGYPYMKNTNLIIPLALTTYKILYVQFYSTRQQNNISCVHFDWIIKKVQNCTSTLISK